MYLVVKSGKDVGEIIGLLLLGVIVINSIDDVLVLDVDVVIYVLLLFSVDEVVVLLCLGKNVVILFGWFYLSEKEVVLLEVVV